MLVIPGARGAPDPDAQADRAACAEAAGHVASIDLAQQWQQPRHGPPADDLPGRQDALAGHRRRQLHQPVLPLRPLRARHRGRPGEPSSRRQPPARSSSPAGSRTAAATRSGSPTAPGSTRRTTTCRRCPWRGRSTSAAANRSAASAAPATATGPALPLRGMARPVWNGGVPRQPAEVPLGSRRIAAPLGSSSRLPSRRSAATPLRARRRPWPRSIPRCSSMMSGSSCVPARAATARRRCGGRPTCRAAGPTAATAAVAARLPARRRRPDDAPRLPLQAPLQGDGRGPRRAPEAARQGRRRPVPRRPARDGRARRRDRGAARRPRRGRPGRSWSQGRTRRPRQHPLRDRHPPGAQARAARRARRGARAAARAPADRRRRPRRPPERRQVDAARGPDRRAPEDRRLPVHDARAQPRRHGPRRSTTAGGRRSPTSRG